ncbi:MAG: hypothetical protein WDZ35_12255 [Crocinitomicaceae bacterium]
MKKLAYITAISLLAISCKKETEVQLTTKDSAGNAVANSEIHFYSSFDNYLSGGNGFYEFTADGNGEVNTVEKMAEGTHYIWAEQGDYSNWLGNINESEVDQLIIEEGKLVSADITLQETYHKYLAGTEWTLTDYTNSSGDSFWNTMGECYKDDYLVFNRDKTFYFNSGDNVCTNWPQEQVLDMKVLKSEADKVEMVSFGDCYKINNTMYTDPDGFSWNFYLETEDVSPQRIIMSNDTSAVLNFIFKKTL